MPLPRLEHDIPGSYQMRALHEGWAPQRAWHRARLDLAASVLPPDEGLSLDLAAGAGILTWRFPRAPIVSVDLRLDACRSIRGHTPGAAALVAELGALPFEASAFSRIYFLETLEHLTPEEGTRALREMRRVIRPGGRCLITTPNYRSHWIALETVIDAFGLTPQLAEGQHVTRFGAATLRDTIEGAGWRVRQLGSFNLIAPLAGMLSSSLGTRLVDLESRHAGRTGALLYALCETDASGERGRAANGERTSRGGR